MYAELGESLTPDTIGNRMLKDEKSWSLIAEFLEYIMTSKIKEERIQQQQQIITL